MMPLPAEECFLGSAVPRPAREEQRLRPRQAVQWLAVAMAHAAVAGMIWQTPAAPQSARESVIQATLISPRPPAQPQVQPPLPAPVAPRPEAKPATAKPAVQQRTVERPAESSLLAAQEMPAGASAIPAPAAPAVASAPREPAASVPDTPPAQPTPPVFDADYLDNPAPPYPQASRRFGEKGVVLLRVLVSPAGRAERVEIKQSSGFVRLDSAASGAVAGWRFVPARRGEQSVAAWVLVPISFVL